MDKPFTRKVTLRNQETLNQMTKSIDSQADAHPKFVNAIKQVQLFSKFKKKVTFVGNRLPSSPSLASLAEIDSILEDT